MSWLARMGLAALAAVALLLVGLGLGAGFVRSDRGSRWLAARIEQAAASALEAGSVEIGDADLRFSKFVVEDLRIHGREHRDVVVVPRIEVSFDVWPLLQQRVVIHELAMIAPRVTLHRLGEGYDLPVLRPSSAPQVGPTTYLPAGWEARASLRAQDLALSSPDDAIRAEDGRIVGRLAMTEHRLAIEGLEVDLRAAEPEVGALALKGAAELVSSDLASVELDLSTDGLRVGVEGAVDEALGDGPSATLAVAAHVVEPAARRLAQVFGATLPDTDLGALGVEGTVEGPVLAPTVDLAWSLGASAAELGSVEPAATTRLAVTTLTPLDVAFTVQVPRVGPWRRVGSPLQRGAIDASGTLRGPYAERATVEVTATGRQLAMPGVVADRLRARATVALSTGRAAAELVTDALDVELDGVALPLAGEVALEVDGARAVVDLDVSDRRDPGRGVMALVDADLERSRAVARELTLRAGGSAVFVQRIPTTASWSDLTLRTELVSELGTLVVDGAFPGAWPTGRMILSDVDLAAVRDLAEPFLTAEVPGIRGGVSASIASDGEGYVWSAELASVGVEGQFRDLSGALGGRLSATAVSGQGQIVDPEGPIVRLQADVPLVAPDGPASLALRCGGEGTAATIVLPTRRLAGLAERFDALDPPSTDLELSATLSLEGDPCDPAIAARATARPELEGFDVQAELTLLDGSGRAEGSPWDHLAEAVLVAKVGGVEHARVDATLEHVPPLDLVERGVDGLGAFAVTLALDGLPLEMALPPAPGRLDGLLEITGEGASLTGARGEVGYAPAADSALPASLLGVATGGDQLQVGLSLDRSGTRPGSVVDARIGLSDLAARGLDASLSAQVHELALSLEDLAALGGVGVRKPTGEIRIQGPIGGTLGAPDPDLRVELRDGGASIPELGVRYEDVQLRGSLRGRRFTIEEGRARSRPRTRTLRRFGRGVEVSGTVVLDEAGEVRPDLRIDLDGSWFLAARDTTLQASGRLRLTRPDEALKLAGRVRVDEGRVLLDRAAFAVGGPPTLHPDIVFEDVPPPRLLYAPQAPTASAMAGIDLDLTVDLGSGVHLEATVPLLEQADAVGRAFDVWVDAEIAGTLRVTQADRDLGLQGRLSPTGRVQLLSARFDIEEGAVSFGGDDPFEPALDLALRRETTTYGTVRARVQGTPSTLSLSGLSSDEFADEADVIAILLFGRPLSEVDPDASGSGGGAVERALLTVAGRQVEEALGGSVFDTVDYSSDDGLSLGWNLGGSGFLTVSVDALADADENTASARLTWLLTRRLEIGVESGDTGTSSGFVVWRKRF